MYRSPATENSKGRLLGKAVTVMLNMCSICVVYLRMYQCKYRPSNTLIVYHFPI